MESLRFAKFEGLGNDFVVIDEAALGGRALSRDEAIALCDRHRGIGADGVLIVRREPRPHMSVINSDGSEPQMCGNGLRCVAVHLDQQSESIGQELEIDTPAGPHRCVFSEDRTNVTVSMRSPSFAPADLPLNAEARWVEHDVDAMGARVRATAVSMGNPHLVVFDSVGERRLELGPALQALPVLPEGANIGFATMENETSMVLHVLERGAGWTQACGTAACAAVSAAALTGRTQWGRRVDVRLPGGVLRVTAPSENAPVLMQGPARHVFDGETVV